MVSFLLLKWRIERSERVGNAKIREVDKASIIIVDAVAETGGDFTRIQGISFSVDDPNHSQRSNGL